MTALPEKDDFRMPSERPFTTEELQRRIWEAGAKALRKSQLSWHAEDQSDEAQRKRRKHRPATDAAEEPAHDEG